MRLVHGAVAVLVAASCSGDVGDRRSSPAAEVFPGAEWDHGDPAALGFDPAVLDRLAAEAEAGGAACFVVVRRGRIAGEWYFGGTTADTAHPVFSVTKSYASTLVGIAEADGLLDVDDPVADHGAGPRPGALTVRHLLARTGGTHTVPGGDSAEFAAFAAAADATAAALAVPQDHEPGEVWALSEAEVQILEPVLESAVGGDVADYARARLLDPIGATHTELGRDAAGNTLLYTGVTATCPDAARLGLLFLRDGRWNGDRVVPARWVEEATRSGQDHYPGYGLLWWLNRSGPADPSHIDVVAAGPFVDLAAEQFVPGAPEDLYWALGAFGQLVQVHPGTDTVVVRLGAGTELADVDPLATTSAVVTEALVTR